jgi:hypothetical protein
MSNNKVNDIEGDFQLIKKDGRVELWYNSKTGSYTVVLYEHIDKDEDQLLDKTVYSEEKAGDIFEIVLRLVR